MKKLFTLIFYCTSLLFAAGDNPMVLLYEFNDGYNSNIEVPISGIEPGGTVTIDWGDGTETTVSDTGFYKHPFSSNGVDTVKIRGDLTGFGLWRMKFSCSITAVLSWGDLPLKSLGYAFYSADKLVSVPEVIPPTVTNVSNMFYDASSFNGDLSGWDVSNITNMYRLFGVATSFDGDLSNWDVSNVSNMAGMFEGSGFSGDISSWDVSNVTNMAGMFSENMAFNGDLSNWNVSNVTNMRSMFGFSGFSGDISSWDVSNVTDMAHMFGFSEFSGDLSGWDVSNVTDMGRMFTNAKSFNSDLSNWDVSSVTIMEEMFSGATSFNGDLGEWDVSNVLTMQEMFKEATSFNCDLNNWDVSNVTHMSEMFSGAISFDGGLSDWDVSNVTRMEGMFSGNITFNGDLSNWDVSNVAGMWNMFSGAKLFNGDLSAWDVSLVRNTSNMFEGATSFNGDLSDWDVGCVYDMSEMFEDASSFNGDLSDWDVSRVEYMEGMFLGAISFNCDLSRWDVKYVILMDSMFSGATTFNCDISDWNIEDVTSMSSLFDFSAISVSNYDKILNNWEPQNIHNDITCGAQGLLYSSDALNARSALINNKQWTIVGDSLVETTFTVTYDVNFQDDVVTITEQFSPAAKYVSPSYFPEREGYKLTGWNSKPDGSGYAFDNSIKITEDITFYAQWEKLETAVIQTDTTTLTGVKGLLVSPNPVPQSEEKVTLVIPSDLSGSWRIGVYDVLGNELDDAKFEAQGGTTYEWDLRNKSGVRVGGGSYVIMAEHTDESGRVKTFRRTVGVAR